MPRRHTERTRYRLAVGDLEPADAAVVRDLNSARVQRREPSCCAPRSPVAEVAFFSLLIGVGCLHGMTARGRGPHFWDMTTLFPCGHEGISLSTGTRLGGAEGRDVGNR